MAAPSVPSQVVREPSVRSTGRFAARLWQAYALCGLLATIAYFWVPDPRLRQALYTAIGFSATVAILAGIRRQHSPVVRPWRLIMAAQLLLAAGHLLNTLVATRPGRSPALGILPDILYVAHYAVLVVGVALLLWRQLRILDRIDVIDATIVALGLGLLWWVSFVVPSASRSGSLQSDRLVALVYPVLALPMLGLLAWLLITPIARLRAFQLIRIALVSSIVAGALASLFRVAGPRASGGLLDAAWLAASICWGAAALHPTLGRWRDLPRWPDGAASRRRLLLLAVAAMLVPVALAVDAVRQAPINLPVLVMGTGLLVVLGAWRIYHLTYAIADALPRLQDAVSRERAYGATATALREATSPAAVCEAALQSVLALIPPGLEVGAAIAAGQNDALTVVAVGGSAPLIAGGATVALRQLSLATYNALGERRATTLLQADHPALFQSLGVEGSPAVLTWMALTADLNVQGAIMLTTTSPLPAAVLQGVEAIGAQVTVALERATLATDIHGRHSEARFRSLVHNASDIITVVERDGVLRYASPALKRLLGYRSEALLGSCFFDLVHPADRKAVADFVREVLATGVPVTSSELHLREEGGQWRVFEAVGNNLLGDTSVRGLVITWRDTTERMRAAQALQESEIHHRAVVDTAFDAIITLTPAGHILSYNRGAERVFGYTPKEAIGHSLDLLIPEPWEAFNAVGMGDQATAHSTEQGRTIELTGRRKDGSAVPLELSFTELRQADGPIFTSILRDVSERKAFEEQLEHQAFHDPLTSLPNRALFMDRLRHGLSRAARRQRQVAVLFLDLDRFKMINDSLGHDAGDQLLVEVASRLQSCVRVEDTVSRFGGDEFTLLLEDIDGVDGAIRVVERVRAALHQPYQIAGHELFVTGSIGIAFGGADAEASEVLRCADLAMYRAKNGGKARYELFDQSMNAATVERLRLESDLRHAVERQEFWVAYQPKVALTTGRIVELEALVRWQHPQRGLVSPGDFIPLAEETSLIVPIGEWVLEEACRQTRAWQVAHGGEPPLVISVNLSGRQFQQANLVEVVGRVLRDTGLPPACLKLEITESVVMENGPTAIVKLQELKALGLKLSIDDFGTGYSSLSYLKRFPVDNLKIDRAFVTGLGHNAEDTAIVRAIIQLAHTLGLTVTAEGIETAEAVAHLHQLGCEMGQGFFFSKPLPGTAAEALLKARDLPVKVAVPA